MSLGVTGSSNKWGAGRVQSDKYGTSHLFNKKKKKKSQESRCASANNSQHNQPTYQKALKGKNVNSRQLRWTNPSSQPWPVSWPTSHCSYPPEPLCQRTRQEYYMTILVKFNAALHFCSHFKSKRMNGNFHPTKPPLCLAIQSLTQKLVHVNRGELTNCKDTKRANRTVTWDCALKLISQTLSTSFTKQTPRCTFQYPSDIACGKKNLQFCGM